MYSIRYNRTTNHIDGIGPRTTGGGNDMGDHISAYAENACGALTRGRFAQGRSGESLSEILDSARKGGRKLCKTCEKAALAALTETEKAPERKPLKFTRTEAGRYRADGVAHIYTVAKEDGEWSLTIMVAETVAGVRYGVPRNGKRDTYDTKADAVAVLREFEALGEDYRSADHGHRERYTEAVTRWHKSFTR
jgi:hypothetical protein